MTTDEQPRGSRWGAACVFVAGLLFLFVSEVRLASDLTIYWPIGGNDEPMHLSMARSIATHGQWPRWDSEDLMRYYGVSYASSSSFNYWIEGLLLKVTGQPRWSPRLLFVIYLVIVTLFARRSPMAGLIGLAAVLPQVLFVFSYVNSDAWTAIVAMLLGLATYQFRRTPTSAASVICVFSAAALCLSCRPHMWAIGFVTFLFAIVPNLMRLVKENRGGLVYSLLLSLLIASWWPVTSYLANNGDILGRENVHNEVIRFATLDSAPVGQGFESIKFGEFARNAGCSFYGWWGWATVSLPSAAYWMGLIVGLPLLGFVLIRPKGYLPLFAMLIAVNFGLMLYGATQYNSMWQGRYLYPAYFVIVGIVVQSFADSERQAVGPIRRRVLISWLSVFLLVNGWSIRTLATDSLAAETKMANPPNKFLQSVMLLNSGLSEQAVEGLRQGVADNPRDFRGRNLLGYLLTQQGAYGEARGMFETALKIQPNDPLIRIHLGELEMREGNTSEAIEQFHRAIVRNPRGTAKQNYLTPIYGRTGRWESVMQACRDALQSNPDKKQAHELLYVLEHWAAQFR